jgi:hypothetical protein
VDAGAVAADGVVAHGRARGVRLVVKDHQTAGALNCHGQLDRYASLSSTPIDCVSLVDKFIFVAHKSLI